MEYVQPEFKNSAFNCPHCGAYAHQSWSQMLIATPQGSIVNLPQFFASGCGRCNQPAIWKDSQMIFPEKVTASLPNDDMPDDVKEDYLEARNVSRLSPRGAAALLRLAIQKIMPHLGEKGKNLNEDIGSLVSKGLRAGIQQALDAVRVIGNNAVHPGQLDLRDDHPTTNGLFDLVNLIVQDRISQPKQIEALFNKIPAGQAAAIQKRDQP